MKHDELEKLPKLSEGELLRELERLNRTGIINDEEFVDLRKIIRGKKGAPNSFGKFDQRPAGAAKSGAGGRLTGKAQVWAVLKSESERAEAEREVFNDGADTKDDRKKRDMWKEPRRKTDNEAGKQERLYTLAEAIGELGLKLTGLGAFDHSRELLSCSQCGLFEDVTFEGMLITAERKYPGIDTGLRFAETGENEWECPVCGTICR